MVTVWEFSCNVYKQEGVQKSCLVLQEDYQVDIPLCLFACWAAAHLGQLSVSQRESIKTLSAYWQNHCIAPLRRIRQQMKESALPEAGFTHDHHWYTARETVKSVELQAEKSLLQMLEHWSADYLQTEGGIVQEPVIHPLPVQSPIALTSVKHALFNIYELFPPLTESIEAQTAIAIIVHAAYSQIQYDSVLQYGSEYIRVSGSSRAC